MTKTKLESRLEKLASSSNRTPISVARPTSPTKAPRPTKALRNEPRASAFKFGVLHFGGGRKASCMVLDLSAAGARITLEGAINLPETVRLSIPQHSLKIDATVRWQRGMEAGLQFEGR